MAVSLRSGEAVRGRARFGKALSAFLGRSTKVTVRPVAQAAEPSAEQ